MIGKINILKIIVLKFQNMLDQEHFIITKPVDFLNIWPIDLFIKLLLKMPKPLCHGHYQKLGYNLLDALLRKAGKKKYRSQICRGSL